MEVGWKERDVVGEVVKWPVEGEFAGLGVVGERQQGVWHVWWEAKQHTE